MGFFFSNLHIKKTEGFSKDGFEALLAELLAKQSFRPAASSEEADLTVFVYDAGGKWLSVCSDGLEFHTEESIRDVCSPLSARLAAELVTISCFDSDCLLLHRINSRLGIDAWARAGSYPDVRLRSAPGKWKGLVDDIPRWKAALSKKPVFAEEALEYLEPMLGLVPGQGSFCEELIGEDDFAGKVRTFYYTLPEAASKPEPPRLKMPVYEGMPCEIGKDKIICAVNAGGKSLGLAVAFSGSYVEHEEIRFRDVRLEYGFDRHPRPSVPLQLEKRQTQDGRWIYYAEIPRFQLPAGIKEGLPMRKVMDEEFRRGFGLRFTPEGDERKRLDVTLHFIPLKNQAGQCAWCVWHPSGSKMAYIEQHNKIWKNTPYGPKPLDPDELDID